MTYFFIRVWNLTMQGESTRIHKWTNSKTEVDPMSRKMKYFIPTHLQYSHEPKATPKGRGCLISPGVLQSTWYKINTQKNTGNSLAVQWLGLSTFTA